MLVIGAPGILIVRNDRYRAVKYGTNVASGRAMANVENTSGYESTNGS